MKFLMSTWASGLKSWLREASAVGSTRHARLFSILLVLAVVFIGMAGAQQPNHVSTPTNGPTLTSDKPDYHPGETVTLTGKGWAPHEVVTIVLTVDPATHGKVTLASTSDASGNFKNSDYVVKQSDLGVTFHITSTGSAGDAAAPLTFTDSIGTPVGIGTNGYANQITSTTSLAVLVTSAVAVNNTVIVTVVALYSAANTVTVTDSAGNSYTKDADIANSVPTRTLVFSARVTTALTTSSTITIHFPSSTNFANASTFSVSGLVAASPADKTGTATGTSTTPSVGPTAVTTQATELLIGAFGLDVTTGGGSPTFTAGASYTALPANVISGRWGIYPEYRIVSATSAYSANGSWNSGVLDWSAAIVTYKAAIASKLVFTTSAFSVGAGVCSPQITVQTQDTSSNPANPDSTETIALSTSDAVGTFYSNNTCTTLINSVTILTSANSANFFWKDTKAGSPVITASGTGAFSSAPTQTETVTPGAATKLIFTTQPGGGQATVVWASYNQPVVTVQDANGNTVTGSSASILLTLTTGPGSFTCTTNPLNASSGIASFTGCKVDTAGNSDVLTATSSGLTSAVSNSFTIASITAITVTSFTVVPSGNGNLIKLQTGREVNNLGFNLYREDGQRVKLNSSLLAGSALMGGAGTTFTAGHTRTWQDDLAGGSSTVAYWLEEIDLSGASRWYGPVSPSAAPVSTAIMHMAVNRSALRGGAPSSAPAVSLSSIGNMTTTSTASVTVAAAAPATRQNLQTQWSLAAGQAVRLGVSSEGWYRVTQPQLVAAGLNPNINPRSLQLYVNGVQQPIVVEGQSDGKFESADAIDFYGLGINTIWSGTQEYWLVAGNGTGLRIGTEAKASGSAGAPSFPFSVQWRPRTIYFAALLNGDGNNFFGPVLDLGDPLGQALTVTHLNIATGGASPLQVTLQGATAGAHAVTVSLNGNFVGNMAFSDQNNLTSSFMVPNGYLHEGANTLGMTVTGGATDVSVVDTVLLTYPHSYIADNDSLRLTAASGQKVSVSGFSSSSIQVIDITDPSSVRLVPSSLLAGSVTFTPQGGGTRTLLAVGNSQFASPASITANHPSSWHSAQTGADMVIISHASLISAVAPLASLRQSQSHTVKVIDVQDLYDEFNFGVESPYAIQSFLSTAKANWSTKPAYVLLMGNGTFDPRNYLGTTVPDLVPAKLVDTNLLETASDDWFADFSNDGIPEMAIGRIPAETISDATNAVNRLIAYDQSGGGGWKNQALLIAGVDQDPSDNFEGFTASVKALLPGSVTATQILAGSDPLAHADIVAGLNAGQSLVNYVGHGSNEVWADGLLSSTDAAGLTNGSMTPFVLSMTCLNGYFQDIYTNPLGKALLNASSGGAVAVWASSGLTDASPQSNLNQAMVSALYGVPGTTIGQAARTAKSATNDINVRRTWILFGDPGMKLQ